MVKEAVVVELAAGGRAMFTAQELGVTFDPVPPTRAESATYGSDEVPRQERPRPWTTGEEQAASGAVAAVAGDETAGADARRRKVGGGTRPAVTERD